MLIEAGLLIRSSDMTVGPMLTHLGYELRSASYSPYGSADYGMSRRQWRG